jgi:SNF2 family DNA or RNA helicase
MLALDGITWDGEPRLRDMARQLSRQTELPRIAVHKQLCAELREYQNRGIDWLGFLRSHGFGGVLADDMGLGKTVQTLAHLLVEKRARRLDRPCLVVAPRSVISNWARECERFAPTLSRAVYHGPKRHAILDAPPNLVVTTYALLQRDEALRSIAWHVVVLDEAQAIKNPRSQTARACRALQGDHRLALTGTPVENHLGDLASVFEFLNPGMLGRADALQSLADPRVTDPAAMSSLARALRPVMLRRTKERVLDDLPDKTEQVIRCRLDRRQRALYDELRAHYQKTLAKEVEEHGVPHRSEHELSHGGDDQQWRGRLLDRHPRTGERYDGGVLHSSRGQLRSTGFD